MNELHLQMHNFLDAAISAAMLGGDILKKHWGNIKSIEDKKYVGDLVTEADKGSEDIIIKELRKKFPNIPLLGEESGLHKGSENELLWVIDPLDGTTNYAHGYPFVGISIALLSYGEPIVGVVYNPLLNEMFHSCLGRGSFLNYRKIQVSNVFELEKSLLATGFFYGRREKQDNNYAEFAHLTNLTQGVRRAGSASIDLAYVGAGRLDGFWENDLNPWDIAAGVLIVKEAGGQVTSYDGTPLELMKPKILATNGKIHSQVSHSLSNVAFALIGK